MLRVKTRVSKSEIAGLGLFADENIGKDQIIYQWVDRFEQTFSPEDYEKLSDLQKHFLRHYSFRRNGLRVVSIDDDRFINHSDHPNTYERGTDTYALRDIKAGEEITCNYYDFDEAASEKLNGTKVTLQSVPG